MVKVTVFLVFCLITFTSTKTEDQCSSSSSSCDECIKKPSCTWIIESDSTNVNRCISGDAGAKKDVFNPDSTLSFLRNEPLSDSIKIAPQHLGLNLRLRKPVFFNISLNGDDGVAPPRFQNIIVGITRSQADLAIARVEALQCPTDPSKQEETLHLVSSHYQQQITLDTNIICTCPSG